MATWNLKCGSYKKTDDIFDALSDGTKTIETRPLNPLSRRNYALIKKGDTLVFTSLDTGKTLTKTAGNVRIYPTIFDLAHKENVSNIVPNISSPQKLIDVFEEFKKKWGKAYKDKIEKYGVVAIDLV